MPRTHPSSRPAPAPAAAAAASPAAGSLARAAFTLLAGGALAQAIPLLLGPLIARLYTPAEFGAFSLWWSVATTLAVAGCARYEFALPLLPAAHAARTLLALCLRLGAALVAAAAVVAVALWLAAPGAVGALWLVLPLAVLAATAAQTLTLWAMRAHRHHVQAGARIVQWGGAALVQVGAGLALGGGVLVAGSSAWGVWGLAAGPVLATLAAAALLAAGTHAAPAGGWRTLLAEPAAAMRQAARTHADFPRYNLPQAVLGALQDTLALAVLSWAVQRGAGDAAALVDGAAAAGGSAAIATGVAAAGGTAAMAVGAAAAGQWALALRYLKAPAALVGGALSQALYPRLAQAANEAAALALVRRLMAGLLLMALGIAGVLMTVGPWLFTWLFGAAWAPAGELARALGPYVALHFVAAPLSVVPLAWGAQRWALRLALLGQLLFVAALALGVHWGGLVGAGWAVSAAMTLYFGWFCFAIASGRVRPRVAAAAHAASAAQEPPP